MPENIIAERIKASKDFDTVVELLGLSPEGHSDAYKRRLFELFSALLGTAPKPQTLLTMNAGQARLFGRRVIGLGRHKDATYADVYANNPGDLEWYADQSPHLAAYLRYRENG